jgi:hypothetical protein
VVSAKTAELEKMELTQQNREIITQIILRGNSFALKYLARFNCQEDLYLLKSYLMVTPVIPMLHTLSYLDVPSHPSSGI